MNVSCETKVLEYTNLLLKWNKAINLLSKTDEKNLRDRHINDSLQLIDYISDCDSVIDVGSGAGFPGIILSLAGVRNVTLIEADTRKSAFLLQASKLSDNKVYIVSDRVEKTSGLACDWLVSRAFASLVDIFSLTKSISINKGYLLLKGKSYEQEISDAQKLWNFDVQVYNSISLEGKILKIKLL